MTWFVYMLLCNQKIFYVGITSDLERRFLEHKNGYSNYTKKFSDIQLVYQEKQPTRLQAEKREKQLKGWTNAKKRALITGNLGTLVKLSKSRGIVDKPVK